MKQEGRKKISSENILDNAERKRIYSLISEKPNLSITQLKEILKINRGTLKHHLILLARHNLIRSEQQKNVSGKPVVFYRTINSSAENLLIEFLSSLEKKPLLESELKKEKFGLPFSFAKLDKLVDCKIFLTKKGKEFLQESSYKIKPKIN